MNDNDVDRILDFMDTFIKDDIIAKIKMFHRGGWSFSSQKIYYESKNKTILTSSLRITCVEFKHSTQDSENTRIDISLKITNPELFLNSLNSRKTQELSNQIKITFKKTDDLDYKEEAYTYNRESFFDNIGKYINSASLK